MVNTKRVNLWLLICFLLLLSSCSSRSEVRLPFNRLSQGLVPLKFDTVNGLKEVDSWEIMGKGDEISLLQYNLSLNRVTAVSEQTKNVTIFSIDREETIAQQILNISNLRVLGLDKEGNQLLVGMSDQRLNEQGEPRDYFDWIAIWNIKLGTLDRCLTGNCTGKLTDPDRIDYAYIDAIMNDETVVAFSEYSYIVTKLSSENGGGIALVDSPEADYWWHIGKVAINSHHNQLAIAFEEGRVELEKIHGSEIWPLKGVEVLEKGNQNHQEKVQLALIDSSGNWLSILRGGELSVWKILGLIKKESYHDQIGVVHGMNFNPSGKLLFIATENHIRVIGLKQKKLAVELQTPDITSLNISEDNRLLFWGDKNGTIHVWGIPVRK